MKEMDTDASPHHHPAERAGATIMKRQADFTLGKTEYTSVSREEWERMQREAKPFSEYLKQREHEQGGSSG